MLKLKKIVFGWFKPPNRWIFLMHLSDTNAAYEVDDAGGEPSPEHGVSGEPVADLDVGAFGGNGVGVAFLERFWQKPLSSKSSDCATPKFA